MQVGQRPEEPIAPQRTHTPMEAKERYRGLAGYQEACTVTPAWPATLGVPMADRAGALQEWWVAAMRREPHPRAAVIIRATGHRRLAPGAAPRYGWAEMPPPPSVGTLPSARARQPARAPRPVPLAGTATHVPCHGARRPGGTLPPLAVSAG